MKFFERETKQAKNSSEIKLNSIIKLVKDLSRSDFNRLHEGMIKYSFHKEKTGIDLDFYTLTILAPRDKDSLDLLFGGEE